MDITQILEDALVSYLSTWKAPGEGLEGLEIVAGQRIATLPEDSTKFLVVWAALQEGPLDEIGNHDCLVTLELNTDAQNASDALATHGTMARALRGIFADGRASVVVPAVRALMSGASTSGYMPQHPGEQQRDEHWLRTVLTHLWDLYATE